jgi:D-glycero-D-manno-heptose 1,7-bisphosphate phosphatase
VGRGLLTRSQVFAVDAEVKRQLDGDFIHAFYHSFAAPEDAKAADRKPSPKLLIKAAEINDLDLSASFFVGDRLCDIECGLNAGCRTVLLTHEHSSRKDAADPDDAVAREKAHFITATLMEAAQWIIEVSSTIPTPKTHEME